MCPDEFGQLGSVKPPLIPTISNIFHALSKTMETSSHLVAPPLPMQLVTVLKSWSETAPWHWRWIVSKQGRCTCFKTVESGLLPLPSAASLWLLLLDYFILIQRGCGLFSSPLSFSVVRAIGSKPLKKPSYVPSGSHLFPLKCFGWLDESLWRWRKEFWKIENSKKYLLP